MNRDDIIKPYDHPDFVGGWVWTPLEMRWIEQRIVEAIAAEREACAKLADGGADGEDPHCCVPVANNIAAAIRARGQA